MLRLLVSCNQESDCRAIARRLRGATVIWNADLQSEEPAADRYDAVVLLRPAWYGEPALARQLRAGKPVLLGEPWRLPAESLHRLLAAAAAHGVAIRQVNPERYLPSRRAIQQELAAGKLGRLGLVRIHCWQSPANDDLLVDGVPSVLLAQLDVALWLFGSRPEIAYAAGEFSTGACLHVHLGFAGGGMALVDFTNRLPAGSGYSSLSVIGSSGAAHADDQRNVQLVFGGGTPEAYIADERASGLAAMAQEFVDILGTDAGQFLTASDGLRLRAVGEAVVDSLRSREARSLGAPQKAGTIPE